MEPQELKFPTFDSFKLWFDEKTENHPFKVGGRKGKFQEDFSDGKVPLDFLREWAAHNFCFIQLTNTNVAWTLLTYMDLWRKHPDLYDIVAAKVGSEFADPAPGGHGRTYVKFARYLGVADEDLIYAKPLPEMEARMYSSLLYRSQSPAQTAVRWMLEGFVGYLMKTHREILHEKYGVPDEILEYFDIHVAADLGEHGPEGEMLLARLYRLGLVKEEDYEGMRTQVERTVEGTTPGYQSFSWHDILYEHYLAARGH